MNVGSWIVCVDDRDQLGRIGIGSSYVVTSVTDIHVWFDDDSGYSRFRNRVNYRDWTTKDPVPELDKMLKNSMTSVQRMEFKGDLATYNRSTLNFMKTEIENRLKILEAGVDRTLAEVSRAIEI